MLDVLLYPVSSVLQLWHTVLSSVLDPSGGAAWTLAVVLLVATLRALLVLPALRQLSSARRAHALRPQLAALRTQHGADRQELARRTLELQRQHGVGPVAALLPALVQAPVVLGLYHVLTQLSRAPEAVGVGALDPTEVHSFLHASLVGTPLSAGSGAVVVGVLLLAGLLSHLTARAALRRQPPEPGPAELVGRLSLWVLPAFPLLGALVLGLPLAVGVYWVSTAAWTLAQTAVLHRVLDGRDGRRATPLPRPAG